MLYEILQKLTLLKTFPGKIILWFYSHSPVICLLLKYSHCLRKNETKKFNINKWYPHWPTCKFEPPFVLPPSKLIVIYKIERETTPHYSIFKTIILKQRCNDFSEALRRPTKTSRNWNFHIKWIAILKK